MEAQDAGKIRGVGGGGVSDRHRSEEERLGAAGWEPWSPHDWRSVQTFWRNPGDGLWHAQEDAIALLKGRDPHKPPTEDEKLEKKREHERRELEVAGWEPKGEGPKTLWRDPSSGHWYAHREAVIRLRKEDLGAGGTA
jgi:hypothetical protein